MPIRVAAIYRYPVKGLSPEPLERVTLTHGECVQHDRRFAIAKASTRFDPEQPEWRPKTDFFMLMRDAALAQLRTRFDGRSGFFTIERDGETLLRARITDGAGRAQINAFFAEFLKDAPGNPPRIVEAPGHTFSDAQQKPNSTTYQYVSLVNLASVGELEKVVRIPVDPLRFRANFYLSGLPAWDERDWAGSGIMAGNAHLRIVSSITRCAATSVNPATATRDLNIPAILRKEFGHNTMGVYAEVVGNGGVARDDLILAS
jgi:uncharacterized protein YcbX